MVDKVTIGKFEQLTGYSGDAVRSKIARGDWLENKVWFRAPDNRILISIEGYETWVGLGPQAGLEQHLRPPSKSRSRTAASAAASE